jgi:hypothetical protein
MHISTQMLGIIGSFAVFLSILFVLFVQIKQGDVMGMLGAIFIIVGGLIALVYGIILLVKAFQTSVLWGLGYIFIPFVALVFVIMHWEETKKPFLMSLLSIPFFIVGIILAPEMAASGPA